MAVIVEAAPAVRIAQHDEIDGLAEMLITRMHPGQELGFAPPEPDLVREDLREVLAKGALLVLDLDGRVVGTLCLMRGRFRWSSQEFMGDHYFFVLPEHRGFAASRRLVEAAKAVARENGLPLLLGPFGSQDVERKGHFFEMCRFQEIGRLYLWRAA